MNEPPHNFDQPWTVSDPRVATLLTRPAHFRNLAPFLGRAIAASEAAREIEVSLQKLKYWIERALEVGLLVPAGHRLERGRKVNLFRTRADILFLPAAITSEGTLESLAKFWTDPWNDVFMRTVARVFARAGVEGLRIARNATGQVDGVLALSANHDIDWSDPALPPMSGGWELNLRLDIDDARQLQQELRAIYARYAQKRGGSRYIMRLALAPLDAPQIFPDAA